MMIALTAIVRPILAAVSAANGIDAATMATTAPVANGTDAAARLDQ